MALRKEIELKNGIVVDYHRIASLNKITNINNIIEINSYTKEEKRLEEKEVYEKILEQENYTPIDVFIESTYIEIPYDEQMTIKQAYEFLKTLEEFNGAIDI